MDGLTHNFRDSAIRERDRRILATRDKIVRNGFQGPKEALICLIKQELSKVYTALPKSEIRAVIER